MLFPCVVFSALRRPSRYATRGRVRSLGALTGALIGALSSAALAAIDYGRDIQPLFDRYCVACHACFDAPCQLDLTHPEGVERGASKQRVYDGTRLEAAEPSRLHIDADSVTAWRERGFFDVLGRRQDVSILRRILDARPAVAIEPGQPLPDDFTIGIKRANLCANPGEIESMLAEEPHLAMPFAMPPIPADDFNTLRSWLDQGAIAGWCHQVCPRSAIRP